MNDDGDESQPYKDGGGEYIWLAERRDEVEIIIINVFMIIYYHRKRQNNQHKQCYQLLPIKPSFGWLLLGARVLALSQNSNY